MSGYEGRYDVSNKGNVRSVLFGKLLYKTMTANGYYGVMLYNENGRKFHKINRLVALAFIPNPDNLPQVNHKDEIKANNCVWNLEWCSLKYNCQYGTRNKRISVSLSKKVNQYTIDDILVKEWNSLAEIGRQTNYSKGNIGLCCQGLRKTAYGFKWGYV